MTNPHGGKLMSEPRVVTLSEVHAHPSTRVAEFLQKDFSNVTSCRYDSLDPAVDGILWGESRQDQSGDHGGERHLDADEVLYLISGAFRLSLELDGGRRRSQSRPARRSSCRREYGIDCSSTCPVTTCISAAAAPNRGLYASRLGRASALIYQEASRRARLSLRARGESAPAGMSAQFACSSSGRADRTSALG